MRVTEVQRARLLSAAARVVGELGYEGMSVARVTGRAGVSRRTFYELFDSRESCFLGAFDWGVEQACAQMSEAYGRERTRCDGVRSALFSLLLFLDSEPQLAHVCVVEALGAGTLVLRRRARVLQELADALRTGAPRGHEVAATEPPLLTAETIVGGAFSVVHTRLLLRDGSLVELLGQLMALILLPYLGARAAGEELARPLPEISARPAASARGTSTRILERLNVRLTYRTVRCLLFVAEHPDASNREVAQGAEIKDEGQASKLLARLAGMDLLSRSGHGPGKPNAWRLTAHGEQVLHALRSA